MILLRGLGRDTTRDYGVLVVQGLGRDPAEEQSAIVAGGLHPGPYHVHVRAPYPRHARARAWSEREHYGRCTARQTDPPARGAQSAAWVDVEHYGRCAASPGAIHAVVQAAPAAEVYGRAAARGVFRAQALARSDAEAFTPPASRRGLPSPAVLAHFLHEIA